MARAPQKDPNVKKDSQVTNPLQDENQEFSSGTAKISTKKAQ